MRHPDARQEILDAEWLGHKNRGDFQGTTNLIGLLAECFGQTVRSRDALARRWRAHIQSTEFGSMTSNKIIRIMWKVSSILGGGGPRVLFAVRAHKPDSPQSKLAFRPSNNLVILR